MGSHRRRQQLARRHPRRRVGGGAVVPGRRCATCSSASRAEARRSTAASGRRAGDIIATTDDDVRVPADWLNRAAEGLERLGCDYVGGRVLPIWGGPRPAWLPDHGGKHWAVIALLDYGPEPIEFGTRVPLGVNMAFTRERVRARRRVRSAHRTPCRDAARPGSPRVVHPRAPGRRPRLLRPRAWRCATSSRPNRLNKRYFRRWFYWRGHQPRAALRALRPRHGVAGADDAGLLDGAARPRACRAICIARRFAALAAGSRDSLRGRRVRAFEHELWLCFFAGIVRQRFRDTRARPHAGDPHGATEHERTTPRVDRATPAASTRLATPDVDATVLICTYNRADVPRATPRQPRASTADPASRWDVLVVDNNSNDRHPLTSSTARAGSFPVPLRYLFEPRQGKSNALNTGMAAAHAAIIVFTDDDVEVATGWLRGGGAAAAERPTSTTPAGRCGRSGVRRARAWLDERGNLGGTIAVKDHGPSRSSSRISTKTPLGVNMAVRRTLIERIGGFRPDLGRNGKALLGQEQAEFFYRSRGSGRARALRAGDGARPRGPGRAAHPQLLPPLVVLEGRLARARPRHARPHRAGHRPPARAARAGRPALRLRQHRSATRSAGCARWLRRDAARSAPSTGCRWPTRSATAAKSGGRRRSAGDGRVTSRNGAGDSVSACSRPDRGADARFRIAALLGCPVLRTLCATSPRTSPSPAGGPTAPRRWSCACRRPATALIRAASRSSRATRSRSGCCACCRPRSRVGDRGAAAFAAAQVSI